MVPRIQYRPLLRLAQRRRNGCSLAAQPFQSPYWLSPAPSRRLRPISTSPVRQQDPKQTATTPEPETSAFPQSKPVDPTTPPPPSPAAKPAPKKARFTPRLLLAITCTLAGAALGSSFRLLLSPPTPPQPHTEEDAYAIRVLHEQAAQLPIVRELDADPDTWESWDAYAALTPEHRAQHISAGALAGSRGIGGFQRVWRHRHRRPAELVSVVYFGSATTGWPGVVHGGCLATLLDESCGRAAFQEWGGRPGLTACLGLEYKKVTLANGFYVVRVRVRPDEELPEHERGKRHYKCWVDASVEDAATGTVTVTAQALFVGGQGRKNGKNGMKAGGPAEEVLSGNARDTHLRF
ncbi:uncharacterized protein THITE_2112770 [Thermothielavioides terrestris NRRL 8126]|uniref:Thioesterase domain-containing protein n=1 Tax=Thermothielavioides terrestris (strain ATCC 38088 / NRRL 8126) TaxID=578455 RepID=G2R0F4_THETT|nr:uncharacterized protein THITE_2112770 [Thermothielavioides terrestris NRRL 8126]AEO65619.1 hypothetical protein THITE_2112770 [Thermothielavioides terrestris NRRL 8126]